MKYAANRFTFHSNRSNHSLRADFDPSDEGDTIGSEGLGANALAGRCEDGVAQSCAHRHRPDLAEAARLLANRDDLDSDVGRLVDTKNLIGIEIGLLGRPTRECDALAHRVA